jgi:hypothetical protein
MKLQPRLLINTRSDNEQSYGTQACSEQQLLWLEHGCQVRVFTTTKKNCFLAQQKCVKDMLGTTQVVQSTPEQEYSSPSCLPWLMPTAQAACSGHASSVQFSLSDGRGVLQQSCCIRHQHAEPGPISTEWQLDSSNKG